jgi:hypothetical protein
MPAAAAGSVSLRVASPRPSSASVAGRSWRLICLTAVVAAVACW